MSIDNPKESEEESKAIEQEREKAAEPDVKTDEDVEDEDMEDETEEESEEHESEEIEDREDAIQQIAGYPAHPRRICGIPQAFPSSQSSSIGAPARANFLAPTCFSTLSSEGGTRLESLFRFPTIPTDHRLLKRTSTSSLQGARSSARPTPSP